jgi:hypothetical protein
MRDTNQLSINNYQLRSHSGESWNPENDRIKEAGKRGLFFCLPLTDYKK